MRVPATRFHPLLPGLVASLLIGGTAFASDPVTSAKIEPAEISLDQSANLTITSSGSDQRPITPPMVPGLEFTAVGQSQRIESVNGVSSSTVSITYQVTAQQSGIYTIPAINRSVQPLILRVDPDTGGHAATSSRSATSAFLANASSSLPAGATHIAPDGTAFVRLRLPKHELYVGESIPVEIQVGTRDGLVASLNGLPTLNGDAFTLDNLSAQPQRRTQEIIGRKPFTVFTWRGVLAAVKPGTLSLTMETPLTVRIHSGRPGSDLFDDQAFAELFNDPAFQNFFGGTTEKDITVASPPTTFAVLPLPTQGRPEGFTGAVGEFQVSAGLSDRKLTAGDPATLRLTVNGEGDFARVTSAMLGSTAGWKTYQPAAKFTSADGTADRGEKIFEQPIIAIEPGAQTVPALSFSYFDPQKRHYVVAQTAPLSVEVAAAPATAMPARADQVASTAAPSAALAGESHTGGLGLRPDRAPTGIAAHSMVPLYFQSQYLALPSVLILAFPGLWFWLSRREQAGVGDPEARNAAAATRQLTEMQRATAAGDPEDFFQAARALLRRMLAGRWQIAENAVTLAEVDARLGTGSEVRNLLALAEEALYSRRRFARADLERWQRIVLREMQQENMS